MRPFAIASFLLVSISLYAATPGTFRGKIVESTESTEKGWIFLQSRNGSIRKVNIGSARITSANAPKPYKREFGALPQGTEVRVTATQENGNWKASEVEIILLPSK